MVWPHSVRSLEGDLGAASIPIGGMWAFWRYRKVRKEAQNAIISRLDKTVAVMAQELKGHCDMEAQHHEVVTGQFKEIGRVLESHIMLTHGVKP